MSIIKDNDFKNKYILTEDSSNGDFKAILKSYPKFKCLICNRETRKRFGSHWIFLGNPPITINNKIPDGVFWINGMY